MNRIPSDRERRLGLKEDIHFSALLLIRFLLRYLLTAHGLCEHGRSVSPVLSLCVCSSISPFQIVNRRQYRFSFNMLTLSDLAGILNR